MRGIAEDFTWVGVDSSGPSRRKTIDPGILDGFRFFSPRVLARTLLDTFDGRLHRAGLQLEAVEGGGNEARLELSSASTSPVHLQVAAVPRFAAELPNGPFQSRILSLTGVRALLPVVSLRGSFQSGALHDDAGKIVVRASIGRGLRVVYPKSTTSMPDLLEVRLVRGYESKTRTVGDQLDRTGQSLLPGNALTLAAAIARVDLSGFDPNPAVPLDPTMPAFRGVCAVLRNLADTMGANWRGTIDRVDPEFLHDLRVAVRRSRSVLAQAKAIVPPAVMEWADTYLRNLGTFTGPARDLDVYLLEWDTYTSALGDAALADLMPLYKHLREQRDGAHLALVADLSSRSTRRLKSAWTTWLTEAASGEPAQQTPIAATDPTQLGPWVVVRIRRAYKKLIEGGEAIEPSTQAEHLHDLRKRAKRLRYLVECFGSLLVDDARKAFVKRLKALQDNLGELQDAEVHALELERTLALLKKAGIAPRTLVAGRLLTDALDNRRRAARAAFDDEFNAYNTRSTTRLLDEALAELES